MSARFRPVVVLYHPGDDDIASLMELAERGWNPVAVINAALPGNVAKLRDAAVELIENAANRGLAHALNQGLERVFDSGADNALLLDQDTRPPATMMAELLARADAYIADGGRLGCLGPRPVDRKATGDRRRGHEPLDRVATIITSGQVITRTAYEQVGGMWNELFIDYIDHEWCFRASAHGLAVLIANDVEMPHDMGDAMLGPRGYERIVHRSPVRHYHWVRNALWIQRCRHVPWHWRAAELARLGYRIPTFLAVSTDRAASLSAIGRGLRDGAAGTPARTYFAGTESDSAG